MINGAKTKLSPRDTHIVQDVVDVNGSSWAEMYKMGDKMTIRPHLVKTEDLTVLPGKRKAAVKARQAIKDLINCVVSLEDTPTHAWNYKDWLQECEFSDEEDDDMESSMNDPQQQEEERQKIELDPVNVEMAVDRSLAKRLDNPSIQMYPQHHDQVALDSVQDLSRVFEDLYEQHRSTPRSSSRLAGKQRTDYRRFHSYGDKGGDREESDHATS